ncbi:MAG: hypothetical protein O7F12_05625 [Nitrospirae bacterium]|nr:hypothetical protein [Nitrospirota bacterium]
MRVPHPYTFHATAPEEVCGWTKIILAGSARRKKSSLVRFGYVGLLILVFTLIGCQQAKPSLTYQPLQEKTFQSRTQPASLSQKSAETLLQEGFVKIGYLSVNVLKETCLHYFVGGQDISDHCTAFPHSDPIPLLLKKGHQVGGDLIVIEFDRPYTEIMNMMARDGYYRKEFSAITVAIWRKND